ncbi:MAG: PAS domain-containing protein [Byssovorax sp.]
MTATLHTALHVFPEPIALVDASLTLREMNAAWREALPVEGAVVPAVATAVRSVLEGRLERADLEAAWREEEGAPRFHFTVVVLVTPDETRTALVHARAVVADEGARERALAEENDALHAMVDALPGIAFIKNGEGRYVLVNQAYADLHAMTVDEVLRRSQREVHQSDESAGYLRTDQEVLRTGRTIVQREVVTRKNGEVRILETSKKPVVRRSGEVQVLGFALDITDRKRAEDARDEAERDTMAAALAAQREADEKAALASELDRQLAVIRAQHQQILELSAPILELGEGVIGVPLVGALDDARTGALTERLLQTITERHALHVILDLTGIEVVDTSTADRLIMIVKAIGLLGARAVITGIRPAVARTMVTLDAGLSGLSTQRTLRDALRALAKPVR